MNITTILSTIYSKISSTTSAEEVLALSKIAEKIKIGNIRTVLTYTEMYTLTDFTSGTVIFVENEEKLYYYVGTNIVPLLYLNNLIFGWGSNLGGRLGDNTTVSKSSPVSVVGGFTDWIQVSNSGSTGGHSIGLRSNGTIWTWGYNTAGQLGDNTIVSKSSPVSIVGGFTDWIQVSAGGNAHSLGLRSGGTAWSWGEGTSGKLGDGTTVSKSSPVSVVGGFTDWVQLSAGSDFNVGLRANGTAWTWGYNTRGTLGDNTTVSKSSPVSVVGGFTDWVQVSAGLSHCLAIRSNGTAWAWGYNATATGKLGDGTTITRSSPVSVVGGFTDWVQVSGGRLHSLGIRSNGTAWAWGEGVSGKLGDGTIVAKSSPVSIVGGFTDWIQVSAGFNHSAGIRANGTAWSWGNNLNGRLGDNTAVSKSSPVSVVGGFTDWVQVSAGNDSSLGFRISK